VRVRGAADQAWQAGRLPEGRRVKPILAWMGESEDADPAQICRVSGRVRRSWNQSSKSQNLGIPAARF
jgi:hypothetical protein